MSRHIKPDHKAAVLALLDTNAGNVRLTALQTGIAERTLYTWKHQRLLPLASLQPQQSFSPPLPPTPEQLEADDLLLRTYIRQAVLQLAAELPGSLHAPDLSRRVSVLNSLLDRLDILDAGDPNEPQVETLQLQFVDKVGRISLTPPWASMDDDEDDT